MSLSDEIANAVGFRLQALLVEMAKRIEALEETAKVAPESAPRPRGRPRKTV